MSETTRKAMGEIRCELKELMDLVHYDPDIDNDTHLKILNEKCGFFLKLVYGAIQNAEGKK